jgi:hypothetical protein
MIVVQIAFLFDYLVLWGDKLLRHRASSAVIKSAAFSWNQDFADYSLFLREIIPEDARVILPPHNVGVPTDHVGYMQYILFPREIHNCGANEVVACVQRAQGGNTYILAVPGFPPKEPIGIQKEFLVFESEWGVYVPIP